MGANVLDPELSIESVLARGEDGVEEIFVFMAGGLFEGGEDLFALALARLGGRYLDGCVVFDQ